MSENFSPNDWRNFLIHKGVAGGSTKYVWDNGKNSSEYNHDWYMANQNEHLARMRELYWKRKNGGKGPSGEDSEEKESKAAEETKTKTETKEAAVDSKIELDEDAPEWLKNYAAEIEKVRKATGNPNWVPAHVNDFNAWSSELKKNYPELNLSDSAAKEVWNTLHDKFGGEKKTASTSSSGNSKTGSNSDAPRAREKRVAEGTATVARRSDTPINQETKPNGNRYEDTFGADAPMSKKTQNAYNALVSTYKKSMAEGKYDNKDRDYVGAHEDFGEFEAEVIENGGEFASEEQARKAWQDFKKSIRK